ncbi:MAG: hypothetical protein BGO55_24795 [Sphingobacteriales bacterium 50-39]|nr:hypothetical protein [Sphingobacteriales bacterium]OJW58505.1 MAG: hypothetical protein BGO55_24795 [Sphingobacteriales bacterium 50-39]
MKHLLLVASILAMGLMSYGQCDKKLRLTSSKTEYLQADSSVQRTVEENTVIEFDKSTITIAPGDHDHLTGTIHSYTCNWAVPYKTGRTRLKVTLKKSEGETKEAVITIDGSNGKVTLLLELDDMPDKKIRVIGDKFEEVR